MIERSQIKLGELNLSYNLSWISKVWTFSILSNNQVMKVQVTNTRSLRQNFKDKRYESIYLNFQKDVKENFQIEFPRCQHSFASKYELKDKYVLTI